jgi:6-phosphogluconate dehydrogenase (decarboxylating)
VAALSQELIVLYQRYSSRDGAGFAKRILSAVRKQFGGHDDTKKGTR